MFVQACCNFPCVLQVVDMPLLFESRAERMFSDIIVVTCTQEQQLQRLQDRNGFSASDAQSRIDSQMPLSDKVRQASVLIDNSGSRDATVEQVRLPACFCALAAAWLMSRCRQRGSVTAHRFVCWMCSPVCGSC